jgi:DNA topoisomerase IB
MYHPSYPSYQSQSVPNQTSNHPNAAAQSTTQTARATRLAAANPSLPARHPAVTVYLLDWTRIQVGGDQQLRHHQRWEELGMVIRRITMTGRDKGVVV